MADVNFISRAEAEAKIMAHWKKALIFAAEVGLEVYVPEWSKMRNYEYEHDLAQLFGGVWVINEWCPFNGKFCQWEEHRLAGGVTDADKA